MILWQKATEEDFSRPHWDGINRMLKVRAHTKVHVRVAGSGLEYRTLEAAVDPDRGEMEILVEAETSKKE